MTEKKPVSVGRFHVIRYIYLYLVTAISIVLILISTIGFLNLILKEYVLHVKDYAEVDAENAWQCTDETLFYSYDSRGMKMAKYPAATAAELDQKREECKAKAIENGKEQAKNNLKRDIATFLSMFLIAFPLYLYHWGIIKKENKK